VQPINLNKMSLR